MHVELTEAVWLDEHAISHAQLLELSGLPAPMLAELIDAGTISPLPAASSASSLEQASAPRFDAKALWAARQAHRLHEELELDIDALVVVLGLLERVAELQAQLRAVRAQLPRMR